MGVTLYCIYLISLKANDSKYVFLYASKLKSLWKLYKASQMISTFVYM